MTTKSEIDHAQAVIESHEGFRPTSDRILVDPIPVEEKTPEGIIIPQSGVNSAPTTGTIVATGPGRYDVNGNLIPMGVKKGDNVMWSKFGGTAFTLKGVSYLLMRDADVSGVFLDA